jgi:hypothetical protein
MMRARVGPRPSVPPTGAGWDVSMGTPVVYDLGREPSLTHLVLAAIVVQILLAVQSRLHPQAAPGTIA